MGLTWDPALVTGNQQIDDQHERIFQIFEDLRIAYDGPDGHQEAGRVLATLSMYVVAHFTLEEDLMIRSGFSGLEAHRASHEDLRCQVDQLVDRFYGDRLLGPIEILDFMANWLQDHVRHQDRAMVHFLQAHQLQPDGK